MEQKELLGKLKGKQLRRYHEFYLEKWLFKYLKGIDLNDIEFEELAKQLESDDLPHILEFDDHWLLVKIVTVDNIDYLVTFSASDTSSRTLGLCKVYLILEKDDQPIYRVHKVDVLEDLIKEQFNRSIEPKDLNAKDIFVLNHKHNSTIPRFRLFTQPIILDLPNYKELFGKLSEFFYEVPVDITEDHIREAYDIFELSDEIEYEDFYRILTKERINMMKANPRFEIKYEPDISLFLGDNLKRLVLDLNINLPYIKVILVNKGLITIEGCCSHDMNLDKLESIANNIAQDNPIAKHPKVTLHSIPSRIENNIDEDDIPF